MHDVIKQVSNSKFRNFANRFLKIDFFILSCYRVKYWAVVTLSRCAQGDDTITWYKWPRPASILRRHVHGTDSYGGACFAVFLEAMSTFTLNLVLDIAEIFSENFVPISHFLWCQRSKALHRDCFVRRPSICQAGVTCDLRKTCFKNTCRTVLRNFSKNFLHRFHLYTTLYYI